MLVEEDDPNILQETSTLTSSVKRPYGRPIRALHTTIIALEITLAILVILSAYTLFSSLSAIIQGGETGVFNVEQRDDPETGDWLMSFHGQPRNQGFLEITVVAKVKLLSLTNATIDSGEDTARIPPGGSGTFTVTLRVPKDLVEQGQGYMEFELHMRTLMDLVGFSVRIRIKGEG